MTGPRKEKKGIPMKCFIRRGSVIALVLALGCSTAPKQADRPGEAGTRLSAEDMLQWGFYGLGNVTLDGPNTIRLSEDKNSKGVMIISPEIYSTDVELLYRVKALNPESVLVALLSLSDPGQAGALTVPVAYDGNIQWLLEETENYFFAFHNAAHNSTPFIRRHPGGGSLGVKLADLGRNNLNHGVWYDIGAGRLKGMVWLKVNGVTILKTVDPAPLCGGRVGLRIRGTAEARAACLIRDVTIRTGER
jgi:hypothetical protein